MLFTTARSLLIACLLLPACGEPPAESNAGTPALAPPPPPAPPPATSVAFTCGSGSLTFDLPCQVGLPLAGTASAVECVAHAGTRTGVVTVVLDLGVPANQVTPLVDVVAPTFGDVREFRVVKGSLVFSRVDTARRTFTGRLQDVAVTLDGVACQLGQGPLSGVAGNFL
jgi:hypothetical protein